MTLLVGEPAISKSTFVLRDALLTATGNEAILRGQAGACPERLHRSGPALVYNAEDTTKEMRRRLAVLMSHVDIADGDMQHAITLWSGLDETSTGANAALILMHRQQRGTPLRRAPGADRLERVIAETGAVLVVLDPLISLGEGADENDAGDMNALVQEIANIAARLRVAIVVVHHTAKASRDNAGDIAAGRGSFAIVGKGRAMATLCRVDPKDAEAWKVAGRDVIRLDYAKGQYSQRGAAPMLFERRSISVGNGGVTADRESIGVLTAAGEMSRLIGDTAPVLDFLKLGSTLSNSLEH